MFPTYRLSRIASCVGFLGLMLPFVVHAHAQLTPTEVELMKQLGPGTPEPIRLWPDKPPMFLENAPPETIGENQKIIQVSIPTMTPYLPDKEHRNGLAVVVCAGGGYGGHDWKTHVVYAAKVFNPMGVAVIGLKYRTRPPQAKTHEEIQALALLDAKRGIRCVRHRAQEWGIDPQRIGIVGYSAGANLAMNLAANFDDGDADAIDPVDRLSSRPDFAVGLGTWHWRQPENPFSFRKETPPVFLVHAVTDEPVAIATNIVKDLTQLGVPVRLDMHQEGGHGVGNLIPTRVQHGFPGAQWPKELVKWLETLPKRERSKIDVSANFPGGNIVLERIEGDAVFLHQELRDTRGDWFYWYCAVRGAQGRELTFHFTQSPAVGLLGPGISRDRGATWDWLGTRVSPNAFTYRFGPTETEVRFSFGMPYQHADLARFLKRHERNPFFATEVMARTRRGTPVEMLMLGAPENTRHKVLVTVRHHACEMMASYVAEGFIDEYLSESETGKWLCQNVRCVVVPMVDKDGVEAGDQGKNRLPHDHKADYRGESIYPEIAALRHFLTGWCAGKADVTLDLHNPSIHSNILYTHALRGTQGRTSDEIASLFEGSPAMRFLQILEQRQKGSLPFSVQDSLDFAVRIAKTRPAAESGKGDEESTDGRSPQGKQPLNVGFEIPYALVGDIEVNSASARSFGHDLAVALAAYFSS